MLKPLATKFHQLYADPRAFRFLAAMAVFGVAVGIFGGVLNNYLDEILKIGPGERGVLEFPRELPGLLLILIVAGLAGVCEVRILRVAMLASLGGLVGLFFVGEWKYPAIAMIVLWSTGEHIMMPVQRSIVIHMAREGREGLAMGLTGSIVGVGGLIGNYLIPVVIAVLAAFTLNVQPFTKYRIILLVAIAILIVGVFMAFRIPRTDMHVKRQKLYFRFKFLRYYILEMFFGARKQVFITFAPFVLVTYYNIPLADMGLLFGIAATIRIYTAQAVGRLIDRLGYRLVIIVDTVLLVILCLLYGFADHLFSHLTAYLVVCAMFVLDNILFAVAMARTMYVKDISDSQEEVTATLSTGISINHLISIMIAVSGGFIWKFMGIETLFSIAAVFGMGSFFFSLTLPRHSADRKSSTDS